MTDDFPCHVDKLVRIVFTPELNLFSGEAHGAALEPLGDPPFSRIVAGLRRLRGS